MLCHVCKTYFFQLGEQLKVQDHPIQMLNLIDRCFMFTFSTYFGLISYVWFRFREASDPFTTKSLKDNITPKHLLPHQMLLIRQEIFLGDILPIHTGSMLKLG